MYSFLIRPIEGENWKIKITKLNSHCEGPSIVPLVKLCGIIAALEGEFSIICYWNMFHILCYGNGIFLLWDILIFVHSVPCIYYGYSRMIRDAIASTIAWFSSGLG